MHADGGRVDIRAKPFPDTTISSFWVLDKELDYAAEGVVSTVVSSQPRYFYQIPYLPL